MNVAALSAQLDLDQGRIAGASVTRRYLRDLQGCFADEAAYQAVLRQSNPLIYSVSTVAPSEGHGQLHYGLGVLMPGRVGREFYLTKGHYHAWREAAEVYLGLRGEGYLLLEEEQSGKSHLLPLCPHRVIYVPGHTAHRTINTGSVPLVYLGIYPAGAGHDYAPIAARNFRYLVVDRQGRPELVERSQFRSESS